MSSRVNYPRFPIQDANGTRPNTSFYNWEDDLPVNWIPNLWLVFMIFPLCMFFGCICSRLKLQREIGIPGRVLYRRLVRIYRSNGEEEEEATIWI